MLKKLPFDKLKYPMIMAFGIFLGLIREVVIAKDIGIGLQMDVYAAVFVVYLFLGMQMANAAESIFISQYADLDGSSLFKKMLETQFGQLIVVLPILIFLYFFPETVVKLLFQFSDEGNQLAIEIVRWFIPAVLLASLTGILKAVLNIVGHYAYGFSYSSIITLSVLLAFFTAKEPSVLLLPMGFCIGNAICLLVYSVAILKIIKERSWAFDINYSLVLWRLGYLVIIAEIVIQCCFTLERSVATGLNEGALTAMYYALTVDSVFGALVSRPVAIVLFPILTRSYKVSYNKTMKTLSTAATLLFIASFVVMIVISFNAEFIVKLLFMRGEFTADDAVRTGIMLSIIIFALPFTSLNMLFKNCLYARNKFILPIFANGGRLLVFFVASLVIIPAYGEKGLAYSYVLGMISVTLILIAAVFYDWLNHRNEKIIVEDE